jgi:hypothetical protein
MDLKKCSYEPGIVEGKESMESLTREDWKILVVCGG